MMKMTCLMFLVAAIPAAAVSADARVAFRDCPKCDKRIRIDLAANKAYVNLSRLEGASRDEVAARAARLLDAAKIPPARDPKLRPLMGWSSWNTFGVDISETIILESARAMATNGLKEAGYTYVNIDDGFFWGHGEDGILRFHPQRFPNGMKPTVDGIHALGLKAGIYSDAGADTCGSMWGGSGSGGKDKGGVGAGLYGHDAADCKLHFNDLGFDFIKVDYCGGGKLKLNEKNRYTEIANAIKATGRTDVRLNLCRWAFPGTWAADIAESWRTTKDIRANWKSVRDLIGENLYLSAYAKPGHYNDMDMLEVGQLKGAVKSIFGKHGDTGLTPDEEITHFGMWCMMSSPLLIGCDVRTIPASTKALITNPYLLAMNQNDLGLQGYVVSRAGDAYILVKDAGQKFGLSRYVALYNGSDEEHEFTVKADALDVAGEIDAFDLVEMADVGRFSGEVCVKVAPHASKFYCIDAERRLTRTVYEAECAFLTDYQELWDATKAGTAFPDQKKEASGGVYVRYIGNRASNDLVWKDVKVDAAGEYVLAFDYVAPEDRSFDLSIDGGAAKRVATPGTAGKIGTVKVTVPLAAGVHAIRLSNATAWMPDLDRMTIALAGAAVRGKDHSACGPVVVLPDEPTAVERSAAKELADGLEKCLGKRPEIVAERDAREGRAAARPDATREGCVSRFEASTRLLFNPRKVPKIERLTEQQLLSILDRPSLKRKIADHVEMSAQERQSLSKDVVLAQERNQSNLFTLTVASPTENGAVRKANAYAEILIKAYVAYRTTDLENMRTTIAARRKTLLDQLSAIEAEEKTLKTKTGVVSPQEALLNLNTLISDQRRNLSSLGEKKRALEQELADNEKKAAELTAMIPEYERLAVRHADLERSVRSLDDVLRNIADAQSSLRNDLRQIERARTGNCREPISTAARPYLFVGATRAAKNARSAVAGLPPYQVDEVFLKSVKDGVVLDGDPARAPIYAVDLYLEKYCGVRWWTSDAATYPKLDAVPVTGIDLAYAPQFKYRETYYLDGFDPLFKVRSKGNFSSLTRYMLTDMAFIPPELGGNHRLYFFEGRHSAYHSFFEVLPPKVYFEKHPEWYSLIDGKREPKQLCLANAEMKAEYVKETLKRLREDSSVDFIQVSQNDWRGYCQCEGCKAMMDEDGGAPSGPYLRFANEVAEAVEKEFPNVRIDTFAYQFTRKAPAKTRPRHNVVVRLCDIECDFARPLSDPSSPLNAKFAQDIADWKRVAGGNLYIWDYLANFWSYMLPHPNISQIAPNIRLFAENGAVGVFEQGDALCSAGSFATLRHYLAAHLLWDPSEDESRLMGEFLVGYYGKSAAPFLRKFIDVVENGPRKTKVSVGCGHKGVSFLTADDKLSAARLMDEAVAAAEKDGEPFAARVRRERLSVDHYMILNYEALRKYAASKDIPWTRPETRAEAVENWIRDVKAFGVKARRETTSADEIESYFGKLRDAEVFGKFMKSGRKDKIQKLPPPAQP